MNKINRTMSSKIASVLWMLEILFLYVIFFSPIPRADVFHRLDLVVQGDLLFYALFFILIINFPSTLLFVLGAVMAKKGDRHGVKFMIWGFLFVVVGGYGLARSQNGYSKYEARSYVATVEESPFQITFPHPFRTRTLRYENFQSVQFLSDGERSPYFTAEFFPGTISSEADILELMKRHANNIPLDGDFSVETVDFGFKGTYAGVKNVEQHRLKFYGVVLASNGQVLNCMLIEDFTKFPSSKGMEFWGSAKLK